ncbi:hypothetical protein ACFQ1E_20320 [Sphingomonas canadensis]|uniref:Antitoxin VbhA domain-containing protein n=1 Tax=Sphingomonas canadensis TaxID=1219257 RepID=A0ABW3HGM7_9SPHN|nr:hypothetical protein [Sphingomonas canadensis]MCW3838396.1 hypothetical protein [Sphingomonas canadensis]
MDKKAPIRFSDDSISGRLQRFEQGLIDADIEGIPPDPEGEALLRDLIVRGVDRDERVTRLKEFLASRRARTVAAE